MPKDTDPGPLQLVQYEPLMYVVKLNDGDTPGRWEAATSFGETLSELKKKHPDRRFQLVPFSYETYSEETGLKNGQSGSAALKVMLAIAD